MRQYTRTPEQNIELIKQIVAHLNAGGMVQITSYTQSIVYEKKHAAMFGNANDKFNSPIVKRGKQSGCFSGCGIRFSKLPNG